MVAPNSVMFARVAGVAAIASLMIYGGYTLASPGTSGPEATLWIAVGLAIALAGGWGLVYVSSRRGAALAALVAAGVAPIAAGVGWLVFGGPVGGVFAGILWLNIIVGALAAATISWASADTGTTSGARRRTPRVG